MSDDLEFIVIDDIPEYIFCIGDDEENEQVIALSGKDGAFKYEKVAELPTTGKDGVLYLVPKSHTTQTASGNPINVNITDNAGKIESLKLDGDTYQQTYTGKNLLNPLTFVKGRLDNGVVGYQEGTSALEATATDITFTAIANFRGITSDYIQVVGGSKYTQNQQLSVDNNAGAAIAQYDSSKTFIQQDNVSTGTVITMQATTAYIRIYYFARNAGTITLHEPQLEAGSTSTDFEPFVGGQPSPNPDYPQQIQTVTGTQTISINGTDYSIDLGTIELCKLGTYQDYIYKDGDEWKVHKATNKITVDGSENWVYPDSGANYTFFQFSRNNFRSKYGNAADFYASNTEVGFAKADKFEQIVASSANMRTKQGIGFSTEGNGWFRISVANTIATTVDAFKTWLSSHSTTIDYALATPTDTTITDQTLIAQLDAIRTASLQNGTNTITNTATGTNLAGDLEIGYYGYDPLNKYDKYFWLDVDGAYEQL